MQLAVSSTLYLHSWWSWWLKECLDDARPLYFSVPQPHKQWAPGEASTLSHDITRYHTGIQRPSNVLQYAGARACVQRRVVHACTRAGVCLLVMEQIYFSGRCCVHDPKDHASNSYNLIYFYHIWYCLSLSTTVTGWKNWSTYLLSSCTAGLLTLSSLQFSLLWLHVTSKL